MKTFPLYFSIIYLLFTSFLTAGPYEEGLDYYEQAVNRLKQKDPDRPAVVALLRKAQSLLLPLKDAESQKALVKVNSMLYWQIKFSSVKDINARKSITKLRKTKKAKPKEIKKKVEPTEEFLKYTETRNSSFVSLQKETDQFAEKYSGDHIKIIDKYFELYEKSSSMEEGLQILSKIEKHYKLFNAEHDAILKPLLSEVRGYDELLKENQYSTLTRRMRNMLTNAELTTEHHLLLMQRYFEVKAISRIYDQIESKIIDDRKSIPVPKELNFAKGSLVNMNEEGLEFADGRGIVSMEWKEIEEKSLIGFALSLPQNNNIENIYSVALAYMKNEVYDKAFDHFKRLIRMDPDNIIRYNRYLQQCELGFKVKEGIIIEKRIGRILKINKAGHRGEAMRLLKILIKDQLKHELSAPYQHKSLFAYRTIQGDIDI